MGHRVYVLQTCLIILWYYQISGHFPRCINLVWTSQYAISPNLHFEFQQIFMEFFVLSGLCQHFSKFRRINSTFCWTNKRVLKSKNFSSQIILKTKYFLGRTKKSLLDSMSAIRFANTVNTFFDVRQKLKGFRPGATKSSEGRYTSKNVYKYTHQ